MGDTVGVSSKQSLEVSNLQHGGPEDIKDFQNEPDTCNSISVGDVYEELAIENTGETVSPAETLLKSSMVSTRPKPLSSRSFVSLDLTHFNDAVGRWAKNLSSKFPNWYVRSKQHVEGAPNEIQYSVFKPCSVYAPLRQMPPEGFLDSGPVDKQTFDSIVENSIEAMELLNIHPKRIAAGSSGSYFVYNLQHEIVAVFKPKDEEPYGPLSPKWTKWIHRNLFPFFFGRSCLIPNLGYICEAAASLLDRQLQTFIVPYTDTVSLSSPSFYYPYITKRKSKELPKKVGSYQLFLNGYEEADQFFKKYPFPGSLWTKTIKFPVGYTDSPETPEQLYFEWTPTVIQQFREELEKLVILDYLMRNTDRGLDNWMIKIEWGIQTDGTTYRKVPKLRIGAIDSGLSWPWKHPDEWRSFPFGWLFLPLPIIGQPFSENTKRHFLPLLTSVAWWEESSVLFRQLFARDTEFKERMWKKQWAVMKGQAYNVVETLKSPGHGPLDLARRTRVLVWSDEVDVPVQIPVPSISAAMTTPIWNNDTRSKDNGISPELAQTLIQNLDSPVKKAIVQKSLNPHIQTIIENEDSASSVLEDDPFLQEEEGDRLLPSKSKQKATPVSISVTEDPFNDSFEVDPQELEYLQSSWTDLLKGNISEEKFERAKNSLLASGCRPRMESGSYSEDIVNELTTNEGSSANSFNTNNKKKITVRNRKKVQKNAAMKRVIVERLETVTSKPPVFTWC